MFCNIGENADAVQGTQRPLTDLRHISLFVAAAFRNVLISAKFTESQWNNTLTSW